MCRLRGGFGSPPISRCFFRFVILITISILCLVLNFVTAENEIVGEALIALKHDELKEMGITSAGHRLTILKSVYETKMKQDIPIDPDHYVAPCELLAAH
jgi:hypothetical protein